MIAFVAFGVVGFLALLKADRDLEMRAAELSREIAEERAAAAELDVAIMRGRIDELEQQTAVHRGAYR